jgi:hypothetical protein
VLHNSTLQNLQVSFVASEIPLPKRFTTSLSVYPSSLRACEKCYVHLALLQPCQNTKKPSYKFWEVINYRRGINDVAQSLIPMTVCPLLYNLSNFIRLGPGPDEDAASNDDDNVEPPKISTCQAQEYLEGLTLFWMQQKESYHEFNESLKEQKEAVKKISMTGLKQKSVLDYFSSV